MYTLGNDAVAAELTDLEFAQATESPIEVGEFSQGLEYSQTDISGELALLDEAHDIALIDGSDMSLEDMGQSMALAGNTGEFGTIAGADTRPMNSTSIWTTKTLV